MDLTKLSTEDLQALQSGDLSRVSTQGLQMLHGTTSNQPQRTQNNDLASQAGLLLRSGIKGASAIPAMLADAITGPLNFAQDKLIGQGRGVRFKSQMPALDAALSSAGLPSPDTPLQRIASMATETATGAGAGAKLADIASRGASGVTQQVLQRLAADPANQAIAGASAGAAGQQSAENGGGWGSQFLSSMLGGLGGAAAASGLQRGAASLRNLSSPKAAPTDIERTITVALERQGIDPASITPALKASLMKDVEAAMKTGQLDDAAIARLSDYRRLDMTPTRGRLTLDPVDVTREQNAMRMAAATGARDAQLPGIAHGNNQRLLSLVDELKPNPDAYGAGSAVINPILARDAAMKGNIDALYGAARDQGGRSAPLNGVAFANKASQAIDESLLGYAVPKPVQDQLNKIAQGQVPFNVDYAEQLKTVIGNIGAADKGGATSKAMGLIRRALDETPLMDQPRVNPGNLPALPGSVPASTAGLGQQAIDSFNAARGAAKQRFGWQESAPGIAKALDGASADTFVQQQILSKGAGFDQVATLAQNIGPDGVQAVRGAIVQHLKDAAIGKGNTTATGNFSGRGWASAIDSIGSRKLSLFFDPAEVEQLKAMGRVGSAETFHPRGSAVNNSNTAAGVAGLLQGLSNNLGPLLSKIPGGQALGRPALDNITLSYLEKGARDVPQGLLSKTQMMQAQKGGLLDSLLLPSAVSGGLLSISP